MDLFDCKFEIKKILGYIDLGVYKYPIYNISKEVDVFKPLDYIIPEKYIMEISFDGRMEFEYLMFLLNSFKIISKCDYYETLNDKSSGVFYNVGVTSINTPDINDIKGYVDIFYNSFRKINNDRK
jgi:hypothetical protein